jgi:hypothetical protein
MGFGSTLGGIAGSMAGSVLLPGVGTFLGGALGSQLGGQLDPSSSGLGSNINAATSNFNPVNDPRVNEQYQRQLQAMQQQQAFINQMQGQNPLQNQQAAYQNYANMVAGNGPSVAQNQLNQATNQNMNLQSAAMGSQRGAGSNVGLMARQIGNQGANIQQNAAGQAATLRAQEQMGAMSGMANMANNQVGQLQNAYGQQMNGALGGLNITQGANTALNSQYAGLEGTRMSGQNSLANTQMSGQNAMDQNTQKGIFGAIGGLGGALLPMMTGNKTTTSNDQWPTRSDPSAQTYYKGGQVNNNNNCAPTSHALNFLTGGYVPGHDKVQSDNIKNDTVPAMLSPGEAVIPLHIMNSNDPAKNAARFVQAIIDRKNKKA